MRFGVNTLIWSVRIEPDKIPLEALREAGVDGLEYPAFDLAAFQPDALRQQAEAAGMTLNLCVINPPGANPISDDNAERSRALEHWRQAIAMAADAGAEVVAGPTCAPVGWLPGRRRSAEEWRRAVDFHQQLGPALENAGVDLAIEPLNRFETFFLNTTADGARLVDEIGHPRIGLLLDTFHSNIEDPDVAEAFRLAGGRIKHVHACENDRGAPGSGHVDFPAVLRSLKAVGYDRWLTIESFDANSPELSAAAAIWRDLAPSQDALAIEGTKYLRRLWNEI